MLIHHPWRKCLNLSQIFFKKMHYSLLPTAWKFAYFAFRKFSRKNYLLKYFKFWHTKELKYIEISHAKICNVTFVFSLVTMYKAWCNIMCLFETEYDQSKKKPNACNSYTSFLMNIVLTFKSFLFALNFIIRCINQLCSMSIHCTELFVL